MNERIKIARKYYPNYLIFISKKDKYITSEVDKRIIEIFGDKQVNKLILDNLNIKEIKKYKNNYYDLYYTKVKLIEILEKYKEVELVVQQ